ncbi:ArsB/NhaD family transporter [Insolitispirillum peregrinum]|uniref:SLC13 family permease n=1 Tax=Insolitispirillum peregrinum TaxID=80876 RepID=UPI0036235F44
MTYLGMAIGRFPGLRLDRTGIALVAAVALVGLGAISPPAALATIDFPTLLILFGLMILSAQIAEAGFYDWCADRMAKVHGSPAAVLALVVAIGGVLAALLSNDVVVFAMTPLLCLGIQRRGLDARPFVLALAAAANAGSAATAIGNPQNILIAQAGSLDFGPFVTVCGPPTVLALAGVWLVIWLGWKNRWHIPRVAGDHAIGTPQLDRPMMIKATGATIVLLGLFLTPVPQAISCTLIAATLLISRRLSSHRALALVDWHLLVLFAALFIVTGALGQTPVPGQIVQAAQAIGLDLQTLPGLAVVSLIGSNTIGNVPADMMLLALFPKAPTAWLHGLALLSTLAGNLLLTGSMANLIAVERAASCGITVSFTDHARSGVPLTLLSFAVALGWLAMV